MKITHEYERGNRHAPDLPDLPELGFGWKWEMYSRTRFDSPKPITTEWWFPVMMLPVSFSNPGEQVKWVVHHDLKQAELDRVPYALDILERKQWKDMSKALADDDLPDDHGWVCQRGVVQRTNQSLICHWLAAWPAPLAGPVDVPELPEISPNPA